MHTERKETELAALKRENTIYKQSITERDTRIERLEEIIAKQSTDMKEAVAEVSKAANTPQGVSNDMLATIANSLGKSGK